MTTKDKIEEMISMGYQCNPDTGDIFGIKNGKKIGSYNGDGYIIVGPNFNRKYNIKCGRVLAHQFIWYWVHNEVPLCIDHINMNRSDNRICNLRSVSRSQNGFNRNAKGYSWHKRLKRFIVQIQVDKKPIYLGCVKTIEEAEKIYSDGKKKYHIL